MPLERDTLREGYLERGIPLERDTLREGYLERGIPREPLEGYLDSTLSVHRLLALCVRENCSSHLRGFRMASQTGRPRGCI